jgi:hypothetical protein
MDKCKTCHERGEQWVLVNTPEQKIFKYCGVIEQIIEDAIDINDIKECPLDVLKAKYRVGKSERGK